jgi:hypothetical protein
MPPHAELKNAQSLLNMHRGNRVLAVTMTVEDWKRDTDLGRLHARSKEMEGIDKALRNYHLSGKTEPSFIQLKTAFDNWIRSQERGGKAWTESDRNKTGAVSRLHEQITLVEAGRSVRLMGHTEDYEARKVLVHAERTALERLFLGRSLVFKHAAWKTNLNTALNAGVLPVASTGMAVKKLAKTLGDGVPAAVTPHSVYDASVKICGGIDPGVLFGMLGVSFEHFCKAAAGILSMAAAPGKLLLNIVSAAMLGNDRATVNRERYMFRAGDADAALDCIIRLIDRELRLLAVDSGKQVATIVANAFQAGPIASAANAVVDVLVNMRLYVRMANEMKRGNELLAARQFSLDLFNASPVLGCYFLVLADTNVWLNFSVHDIGTPGWMDTVERMRKRAEPVRDKARELIRMCKYAVSGTERMNGLEWEASWQNNKIEFLTQHANFDYLANKGQKVGKKVINKIRG